eukprot:1143126-Pelagomonas_calceolata.AAC.4
MCPEASTGVLAVKWIQDSLIQKALDLPRRCWSLNVTYVECDMCDMTNTTSTQVPPASSASHSS